MQILLIRADECRIRRGHSITYAEISKMRVNREEKEEEMKRSKERDDLLQKISEGSLEHCGKPPAFPPFSFSSSSALC